MEITIVIPDVIVYLYSISGGILKFYLCAGALIMFPWSVYRASGVRNSAYYHGLTLKGVWLFISVWVLWPVALYGMHKRW